MKSITFFLLSFLYPLLFFQACGSSFGTSKKELLIQANEELLNKGNLDFADQVFADTYRGQGPTMIKDFVKIMRAAFPDLQVTVDLLVEESNFMAWRRTHTGTHQGEFLGFIPTGQKITWVGLFISEYENGKVIREWGSDNLKEVLEQASETAHSPEEVIEQAKGAVDALNHKDAEAYDSFLHPDFSRFLAQSPNLLRENDPKRMSNDFQNGLNFAMQLQDLEVAFYENTAIVTGYETGSVHLANGQVIDGRRKYSSVWINEGRRWKEVHLHISK